MDTTATETCGQIVETNTDSSNRRYPFPEDTPRTTRFAKGDKGDPSHMMFRGDFPLSFTCQEHRYDSIGVDLTGRTGEFIRVERQTLKHSRPIIVRDYQDYVITCCDSEEELNAFVAAYGMIWEDTQERARLQIGPNDNWAPLNIRPYQRRKPSNQT